MINPNDNSNSPATPNDNGVAGLVRQLTDDVTNLLTKEAQLAKAEVREAAEEAKAGLISMGAGIAVAFSGVIAIILGFIYALALFVPAWIAAFAVGITCVVIGYLMLDAGKSKVKPSNAVPERTINAIQDDAEMAKRKVK